ncbi:GNAT family N-acetyltransferase [Bacillus testis]|uniref:GNAT family N-acetyltransferase n=1 Tax=Bacillus testis TaxID=1622072 RepID=UPI00067F0F2F|nr:GNAT family N-acetyltransferase [Bacillus testis]
MYNTLCISDRLILRQFAKEDSAALQALANNRKVGAIIGLPYPYTVEMADEWIKSHPSLLASGTEYPLAIIDRICGQMVGTITLRVDKANRMGEIGYWIGASFWGRGYAPEAVRILMNFAFKNLQLNKIWAAVLCRNHASIRVLEKVGMVLEATMKEHRYHNGKYEDLAYYCLFRRKWQSEFFR